jgi:prolyl 4-hydroxylase
MRDSLSVALTDLRELQRKAMAGDPSALGELGARLYVGREAPHTPVEGMEMLRRAAAQHDGYALRFMAVLTALGIGCAQSWGEALQHLSMAAAAGDTAARDELVLLEAGGRFDPATWLMPPAARVCFERPRISVIENFLAPEICIWLIGRARPMLEGVQTFDAAKGGIKADRGRTNSGAGFSVIDTDVVMQLVHARIAAALDLPLAHQEPTNILHYFPGQEFLPHFDFIAPRPAMQAELAQLGQRVATFLIYLNDDFDDGETAFPKLDWRFKGKTGDALLFWNVTDGAMDPQTLHAGLPPTRGEKWLFSKWVRGKPHPLL